MASVEQAHWRLTAQGRVQGVGLRPFVYQLATELELTGQVWNHAEGVTLEIAGPKARLECFLQRFHDELPALASLTHLHIDRNAQPDAMGLAAGFKIQPSPEANDVIQLDITPDTAPCEPCLSELRDPDNRRYHYPFINCTQCGPRYTLIERLPYDRPNTSMAEFELCPSCDEEYHNPADRRFHAQPNACSECGPRIWLEYTPVQGETGIRNAHGAQNHQDSDAIIRALLGCLKAGQIAAIRGVGGFHLVCDARNAEAIERLRARKHRPAKPLAVMVSNTDAAAEWVRLDRQASSLLQQASAPIVLLPQNPDATALNASLSQLAPGLDALGMMLPQSPLHHLLFMLSDDPGLALVMTSGNVSGEPLVTDNEQARQALADIADVLLLHNREIVRRNDDSVVSLLTAGPQTDLPLVHRIGRGLAPLAINLTSNPASQQQNQSMPSVLALGSYLKNTIALNLGERVCLSPHIGDLDHPDNCALMADTADQLMALMNTTPDAIVCDLHPEGFGRQLGERLAQRHQVPLLEVPHHIAHIAAVAVDQGIGLTEPDLSQSGLSQSGLLGLALDGFGFGWDQTSRGGELIRLNGASFEHLGSLSALPQPGADKASREPWRMTLAALLASNSTCGVDSSTLAQQLGRVAIAPHNTARADINRQAVLAMLERDLNCPPTTSAGRWFDAVAGLFGVCSETGQTYEGEAAMRLEALARRFTGIQTECLPTESKGLLVSAVVGPAAGPVSASEGAIAGACDLNLKPLFGSLAERVLDAQPQHHPELAWEWHWQLAQGLAAWVNQALVATPNAERRVVLSGGCIQNSLLRQLLTQALEKYRIKPILPQRIPVNDAGISLGQLAWAHQLLQSHHNNNL